MNGRPRNRQRGVRDPADALFQSRMMGGIEVHKVGGSKSCAVRPGASGTQRTKRTGFGFLPLMVGAED